MSLTGFLSYSRVNWQQSPSKSTPLSAANLNAMDAGIKNNNDMISNLRDEVTQLNSNIEIKYYNTGEKEIDIYDSYTDTGQKYNMLVGAHILIGFIRNATNSEILVQAALYLNNSRKAYTRELSILPYGNTSYIIPLVIESPSEIKLMLKSNKTSAKVNFVNFTDIRFKNR